MCGLPIGKICPNCEKPRDQHTEAMKKVCGRAMSEKYKQSEQPRKKMMWLPEHKVNK